MLGESRRTRMTVEECHSLRVRDLVAAGVFTSQNAGFGTISWSNGEDSSMTFRVVELYEKVFFLLFSALKADSFPPCQWLQVIKSAGSNDCFRWFSCPGLIDKPCGRQVNALYRPPGATLFACRHCFELTYSSVQKHDKRVDLAVRNPDYILQLLRSPKKRHQLLGVAAATKLQTRLRRSVDSKACLG